jgi:hypothetical protein
MNVPDAWPQVLNFFGTPLVIEPSQGQLSSDAGLLPIRRSPPPKKSRRCTMNCCDDRRVVERGPGVTKIATFQELIIFW